ncbi:glycosyltransferase family 2 protein [Acidobacteriota bacterium]
MSPQLSIITPIYNRAEYITRCYHNLLQQSYSDWEWIVVDDGSSDNTVEIIKNIHDDRIHLKSWQENKGRGFARTQALNACKGKWVVIWDSDDLHFPDRLEQIDRAQQQGYDFFCSYAVVVDNNFNIKGIRGFYPESKRFPGSFVHTTMACHLEIAKNIGYRPGLKAGEDLSILWTLSSKFKGMYFKDALSIFHLTDTSLNHAIECNLGHHAQLREFHKKGIITGLANYIEIKIKYLAKLLLLFSLRICPSVHQKLTSLSSKGEVDSEWKLSRKRIEFIENLKDCISQSK